jgi:lipopolysaccharide transport system ATP-binding protein
VNGSVITFKGVSKSFPLYHHITGGFKHFLFNAREGLKTLRSTRFEALTDISFEVQKGETFGIIGRNGAGKSTMLGLIAGVMKPSTGRISVRGRVSPLLELGAGFNHELTGRENIILNGILMGLTRAEVMGKLDEIIDFSELGDFIDQPIRVYSSGMLARLGFSVVSSLDPEILLIDEILAVGDIDFQKKCLDRMMHFKNSGVTIVYVSHGMDSVNMICGRALWIEDHRGRMLGDAREVTEAYVASM